MIPNRHRADEFSLSIRWAPRGRWSDKSAVPGFYLMAGFANEGEAKWLVEGQRLDAPQLERILAAALANGPALAQALSAEASNRAEGTLRAARSQAKAANARAAAAEAALRAAGIEVPADSLDNSDAT